MGRVDNIGGFAVDRDTGDIVGRFDGGTFDGDNGNTSTTVGNGGNSTLPPGRNLTDNQINTIARDPNITDSVIDDMFNDGTITIDDARALVQAKDEAEAAGLRPYEFSDGNGGNASGTPSIDAAQAGLSPEAMAAVQEVIRQVRDSSTTLQTPNGRLPTFSELQQHLQVVAPNVTYDVNNLYNYLNSLGTVNNSQANNGTDVATTGGQNQNQFNTGGTRDTNNTVNTTNNRNSANQSRIEELQRLSQNGVPITPEFIQEVYPDLSASEANELHLAVQGYLRDLYGAQGLGQVQMRGVGNTFGRSLGDFSTLAQQALNTSFNRFLDVQPITNFFEQQELGDAFGKFLSNPQPTRESLSSGLQNILGALQGAPDIGGTNGSIGALFRAYFNDPQQALSAGIQPFLMGVSPRMRNRVGDVVSNSFGTQFAQNPQNYDTIDDMVGLFSQLQNAGFF